MLSTDKKEFATALRELMSLYNKPADPDIYGFWFNLLKDYSIETVKNAFVEYAKKEKFPPVPAGVIKLIPSDKVLTAEEAWSHVPKLETESAWVTRRMMSALGVVEELIATGYMINARYSFISAYNNTPEDNEWYYSEAYNVPHEEKEQRRLDDYKLLRGKRWIPKIENQEQLMIENGSKKMQNELEQKRGLKSLSTIREMISSSQSDTGDETK